MPILYQDGIYGHYPWVGIDIEQVAVAVDEPVLE